MAYYKIYPLLKVPIMLRNRLPILALLVTAATVIGLAFAQSPQEMARLDPNAQPVDEDRGTAGLSRALAELQTRASMLMIVAHPDDEDGGMLAAETRGRGTRALADDADAGRRRPERHVY